MADTIQIYAEMAIHEGKTSQVKELMASLAESTKSEPGVLSYQFYLNDDETVLHAVETYQDGPALLEHLGKVGEAMGRLMSMATIEQVNVMGEPPAPVRDAFAAMNPTYLRHLAGFTR